MTTNPPGLVIATGLLLVAGGCRSVPLCDDTTHSVGNELAWDGGWPPPRPERATGLSEQSSEPDATFPPADAAAPDNAVAPDGPALIGLPYPKRPPDRIKGVYSDLWGDRQRIIGARAGGISVNLVWQHWEPAVKKAPCAPGVQPHEGHCFKVPPAVDAEIKAYSAAGVIVTGVLYGVPPWAREAKACSPVSPAFAMFCTPNDAADYGRFVGMIARRYDGLKGHGRVADFVIHNEVNANVWFDIGCGQGTPCDVQKWLDEYAANYRAAYDAVVAEQSAAKVLVSLEHHFGPTYDRPADHEATISGETFLKGFAARVGPRAWRVAYHAYPPNLLDPAFSPEDYPKVTFGNLGVLVGWLRRTFPSTPSAWTVQLTENGINSLAPSSPALQAKALCDAFRNVLGTPGIESFIYHRMRDHPDETVHGLGVGLHGLDGSAKPAWYTWALANRADLDPPRLSCGFEDLPYTRLTRYHKDGRGHWVSSRRPPKGFAKEVSWRLHRVPRPASKLLWECVAGENNRIAADAGCGGQRTLGPVGYALINHAPGTVALYACSVGAAGLDHFVSTDAGCEGQGAGTLLGHAVP